jgi:hypothetical protein
LQPIVAVQTNIPKEQNSTAMAILVFAQLFGAALFLSFGELIFTNGLTSALATYEPSLDPNVVINAGAAAIRDVVPADQLEGVLKAYAVGVDHVFYLATGAGAACLIFCWGMGWKKVTKAVPKESEDSKA